MSRIIKEEKRLVVPENVTIPFIEGDGVGKEITSVCLAVVDAAVNAAYKGKRQIKWKEVLAGEKAFKYTGKWLPNETMQAFKEYIVGLKGPLTTPVGGGIRSLNVALRQELDLYVCLRPVRWFKGVESPLKNPQDAKASCVEAGEKMELSLSYTGTARHRHECRHFRHRAAW